MNCIQRTVPAILCGLAMAALPATALRGADEFKTKAVKLEAPPGSQHATRRASHDVVDPIVLGPTTVAAKLEGKRLIVAARPGEAPSLAVSGGKELTWSVGERPDQRRVTVRFEQDSEGAWSWYVPEARELKVAGATVRLYDLDGDGRMTIEMDGWSAYDAEMVCPLEKELVVGSMLVALRSVAPDGSKIVAEITTIAGTPAQLGVLQQLNERRMRNGLSPVRLDPELSRACTRHAEYLELNGWTGMTDPHSEPEGTDGASEEGVRAARASVIVKGDAMTAVDGFWRTYYHRLPMMSPRLRRIGVNATPPGIAVIDTLSGQEQQAGWLVPVTIPGHRGVAFPATSSSELPQDPVANFDQRGGALMALFEDGAGVEEFAVSLFNSTGKREQRVDTLLADQWRFPNAFGVVPVEPLESKATYRATFSWKTSAGAASRTVMFRTE